MRVMIATVLSLMTVAAFGFVGALPALLDGPTEGFQAGQVGYLAMIFLFALGFGVVAAVWVFLFAFAFLSPSRN